MITVRSAYARNATFSFSVWVSCGWESPFIKYGGEGFPGGEYPSFNRRAGYPHYNSGSELELGPVRVRGCRPGVETAWAGTGDVYAIVISYSYTPSQKNRGRNSETDQQE